ncbi:MAG TPA: PQQ-binding-like beta-propeller repeat protein [Stellaceae bacterium]|nr:PQQ-binding-like beta-propeller repeat protein [Stellaceae bacterium]
MKAAHGRLIGATLALASLLCAAHPYRAMTQEAGSPPPSGFCSTAAPAFTKPLSAPHWNGWGADPAQHRFQSAAMAQLAAGDVPRLKLKWVFGFPGANRSYAQPTVIGGRIFVGSQSGKVYALDARRGCIYWERDAGAPVRSAITIGQGSAGWVAYFGDLHANVHAVDALTGKPLWTIRVEDHPFAVITGAPTLAGTTLFVPVSSHEEAAGANPHYACCSFRGSIVALNALTGKLLWKSYTIAQEPKPGTINAAGIRRMGPSGAAIWSSPAFDAAKGMVYATTGDNYSDPTTDTSDAILAFDAASGKLAWSRQVTAGDAFNLACVVRSAARPGSNCPAVKGPDLDFGSSAILVSLPNGRRALIAGQKSGMVTAVDPDRRGAILWQKRVGRGGPLGGVQWGSAVDDRKIYVAVSDTKFRIVPAGTPGAQRLPFNPRLARLLDSRAGGGLHALRLDTGEEVWRTPHPGCHDVPGCGPAQSAAVTAIPGIVFSGGLDGHLRAYAAEDGRIVWDVDTKGEYRTVNGIVAHGGSIDGPGAVVAGGMLYVDSGSGAWGGTPGNVLLAYSVDGR